MTMLEVLTAIALVFALLAFFGPRRKARLALEAAEDQVLRYQRAVDNLDKWCGYEFPQARLIAAHLTAIGEGHGLNAGTPHADEPCTVNGLREQLRRLQPAPAEPVAKSCEWTTCPTRVGNVCCNDRAT